MTYNPYHNGYPNGEVPASARKTVAGISLWTRTAIATGRLIAAAKADKVTIGIFKWGGYRDLDLQAKMKAHPALYGSLLPSSAISWAGFSTHGWGTAVDFAGGRAWLNAHAHEFGFSHPEPVTDANHYEHDGHTATTTLASVGIPTPLEIAMSNPASPFIKIYDGTHKVGYLIDLFDSTDKGVRLLGTSNSLEWRAQRDTKATKADTAEIQREVNERGIDLTGWESRLGNFAKGVVLGKSA